MSHPVHPARKPDLHPWLDAYLTWCAARALADSTRDQYKVNLNRYIRWSTRTYGRINLDHTALVAYLAFPRPGGPLAPRTVRLYVTEVKAWASWLARTGRIPHDPLIDIPIPREPKPTARDIPLGEVELFVDWLHRRASVRFRAVALLLVAVGPRVAEIAGAKRQHLRFGREPSLRIVRKGGDEVVLPVHPAAARALAELLATYDRPTGALIEDARQANDDRFRGKHVQPATLGRWVRDQMRAAAAELAAEHGMPVAPTLAAETAHSFRHTLATALRRAGVEPEIRAALLGHSLLMAERYSMAAKFDGIWDALAAAASSLPLGMPLTVPPATPSKPVPPGSPAPSPPPPGPKRPQDNRPPSKPRQSSRPAGHARQPNRPQGSRARRR